MNAKPKPPYVVYAAILAAIVMVRVADLVTRQAEWTVWVYQSSLCRALLFVGAVATSLVTAVYARSRVAKVTALLLCGLAGSATMLLTDSSTGMVIGFVVGTIYLFTWPRRICRNVARLLIRSLAQLWANGWPALSLACLTAIAGWLAYTVTIPTSREAGRLTFWMTVSIGVVVWICVQRRYKATWRWTGWMANGIVFALCLLVTLTVTILADGARRRMAVAGRIEMDPERFPFAQWPDLVRTIRSGQLPPAALFSTLLQSNHMVIGRSSTDKDVEYVQPVALPLHLSISSTKVSDDVLSNLPLRQLISLTCGRKTLLTDETLKQLKNSRHITGIDVTGPRITDNGLSVLSGFSKLQILSMPNTQVTARGLGCLNRNAPLAYLNLADTQVGDEVFLVLADFPSIRYVNLRGTPITGQGLKHLRNVSLGHLDLSDTKLNERFLEYLLQPMPSESGEVPGADLEAISLNGVQLSAVGVKTLARTRWLNALSIPNAQLDEASIQALTKLRFLDQLIIPAHLLTPETLGRFAPMSQLTLVYDAKQIPLAEIERRFLSLSAAHRQRMQLAGATTPNVSLIIRNLMIDEPEARQLLDLSLRAYQLELESAEIHGRETKEPVTIFTVQDQFPHLLKIESDSE